MSSEESHALIGQSVGAKLRAARLAQKMTQSQLATPDFSVSYISAIERGQIHPSLRALEILANRLGLSSTQLLPKAGQDGERGSIPPVAPSNEENLDLLLLEAQVCLWQGEFIIAVARLEPLTKKRMDYRRKTRQRSLLGAAYLAADRLAEAEAILSDGIDLARDHDDSYSKIRLYYQLGLTHAAMHNYAQALSSHEHCLKLMEEASPDDPFLKAQIYFQMGQHATALNEIEMALEMFQQAILVDNALATADQRKAAYWAISQHYIDNEDYTLAALYAHKSQFLADQQSSQLLMSEIYHYLGRAILRGDQEAAHTYLMNALQDERVLRDQLARASITTSLAEWFLKQKALREAEEHAIRAYNMAVNAGDTIVAKEALLTLARIEYALDRYKDGDGHFVAGLEMLERLGLQEELTDQMARYAQLLEERGMVHEALQYFRRAFEGRQKITTHG
ncbi:MAG TPA: helix-turn-helix domain-containing protein [Ktedonobacteraceae bacterium]|nr:helix-turn-helix domain-containing protein [Ktedonobacteraceae bacterium]